MKRETRFAFILWSTGKWNAIQAPKRHYKYRIFLFDQGSRIKDLQPHIQNSSSYISILIGQYITAVFCDDNLEQRKKLSFLA
jgi:hypothetical protein